MKVVSFDKMRDIEQSSMSQEKDELFFMQKAGELITSFIQGKVKKTSSILFVCGKGNNGGDALCSAYLLQRKGYHVKIFRPFNLGSKLNELYYARYIDSGGEILNIIKNSEDLKDFDFIIDGFLGIGCRNTPKEEYVEIIKIINKSNKPVISIDVPSGISENSDYENIIKASYTLTLGLPKTPCFFGNSWESLGKLEVLDICLDKQVISNIKEDFYLIELLKLKNKSPSLPRSVHKYTKGYVIGFGGSEGQEGALGLASKAALKSGAGIVTAYSKIKKSCYFSFAPEVIRSYFNFSKKNTKNIKEKLQKATSVFLGPGLGKKCKLNKITKELFKYFQGICVVDADALNQYAEKPFFLPENKTIFTPHFSELKRLLGKKDIRKIDLDVISQVKEYSQKKKFILVVKGSPTFIIFPSGETYVNIFGNPGMATAGCGDVLTGIISGCLCRKGKTKDMLLTAVCLHSLSGDHAREQESEYSMNAFDIIQNMKNCFLNN